MRDYSLGKVYKIISNNSKLIYIGSCIVELRKRLYGHKHKRNNCSSNMVIECGECDIVLIEKYSCNDKTELRMREQYWIDHYKENGYNVINKYNAYKQIHKTKESRRQQYIKNKEQKNNEMKEWRKNNKDYHKDRDFFRRKRLVNVMSEFIISLECY